MQAAAKVIGVAALAMTIVPPALFMVQKFSAEPMKAWMIAGCILWFAIAPFALRGGAK